MTLWKLAHVRELGSRLKRASFCSFAPEKSGGTGKAGQIEACLLGKDGLAKGREGGGTGQDELDGAGKDSIAEDEDRGTGRRRLHRKRIGGNGPSPRRNRRPRRGRPR